MLYRAIELIVLFLGIPLLYVFDLLPDNIIIIILVMVIICLIILLRDPDFDRRRLWNSAGVKPVFKRILIRFAVSAVILTFGIYIIRPGQLFNFIREAPSVWILVMILYPLFSVYPQELIYRAFFFHRYGGLFPGRWAMIFANAAAFGFAHIIFENALAVILTLAGGFIFARTYERSNSILAVSIEHALYGDLIFTIGLGMYFYHGAVR